MAHYSTDTTIPLDDPPASARRLIAWAEGYGLDFRPDGTAMVADTPFGRVSVSADPEGLHLRGEADDQAILERMRATLAEQLVELFGEGLRIVWTGDVATGTLFADFREIRVTAVRDLTPRLRRVTFQGRDLDRFAPSTNLHVRLYLPPEGEAPPVWPRPGPDGRPHWPPGAARPAVRYYTLRRVDAARGELDIDFVRHPDGGPGAGFAERVRFGDLCGMSGPYGLGARPADWHLLAGDETALPAIARILEELPTDARGVALVEVEDAADELPLEHPEGVNLCWLHRRGSPPEQLFDAVAALEMPDGEAVERRAWIACEFHDLARLRDHLRERGLSRDELLAVAYWRRESRPSRHTPDDRTSR